MSTVLVTGGAGYVGSALIPKLLDKGHTVKVLDLYLYGDHVLNSVKDHPALQQIKGDIRNVALLRKILPGCDSVIHLACISNDPSFELNPELGKSINYDAFTPLVQISKDSGVRRFIYASSSSVYGVKEEKEVTENLLLEPLTDYSRFKALCEEILFQERAPGFSVLILRPATVCGYAPRLRLDLTVNILTNHAVHKGEITVFGGDQMRPNIHIDDVVGLYIKSLEWDEKLIDGKIYNAGYDNSKVMEIAQMVQRALNDSVKIKMVPTDDHRSYHISSEKIKRELGFSPKKTVQNAIEELIAAFRSNKVPNPLTDIRYYNIKTMQAVHLK